MEIQFRRLTAFVLALVMVFSCMGITSFADATSFDYAHLRIGGAISGKPGDTVRVPIYLEGLKTGEKSSGIEAYVNLGANLTLKGVEWADSYSADDWSKQCNTDSGYLALLSLKSEPDYIVTSDPIGHILVEISAGAESVGNVGLNEITIIGANESHILNSSDGTAANRDRNAVDVPDKVITIDKGGETPDVITVDISSTLKDGGLYFLGDTVTVTVKASDPDATVMAECTTNNFEQDGDPVDNGDGSYTFTFKVVNVRPTGRVSFKATAEKGEATGSAETIGLNVNFRNRIHLVIYDSDGTKITDANVIRRNNFWSDTYQPTPQKMTYREADGEYRCGDWDVSNDDNGTIIITLNDGRTATITTDKNGKDILSILRTGNEEVYCEYTFAEYQVIGKLFFNGKAVLYDGHNQETHSVYGKFGTDIPYTEIEKWAEARVLELDKDNNPTKTVVETKKDGGTVALDEFKFGDAGKPVNHVYVNVKTYYDVTFMNDDEIFAKKKEVEYGTATPIPETSPERVGYTFNGWREALRTTNMCLLPTLSPELLLMRLFGWQISIM